MNRIEADVKRKKLVAICAVIIFVARISMLSYYMKISRDENVRVKETIAGFYLYDSSGSPIFNNQQLQIESDGQMEFNVECVNGCDIDLNYILVILVNDYYQNIVCSQDSKICKNRGLLQKRASEMINIKFSISNYNKKQNDELRIIMFYYPREVPENPLDQVVVGDAVGIYPLAGLFAGESPINRLLKGKEFVIQNKNSTRAVWLTEGLCKSIPKFDYILDIKGHASIYFCTVGESKKYIGMILKNGKPIKMNGEYAFWWKQKAGNILNYEFGGNLVDGDTIFAYMYESGAEREQSYVTNLYRVNCREEE